MPTQSSLGRGKPELERLRCVTRMRCCSVLLPRRISFWPAAPIDEVEAAVRCVLKPQQGFSFSRRRIPDELIAVRGGLRYTTPALTAIDLATSACSDAIDIALRGRAATLSGMYEALRMTPHRTGNLERLRLLIDSRNEPWSAAERLSHRLLRAAGITGWRTNLPVEIDSQIVLHRHRVQTAEIGDRDRRPAARDGRGTVRVRSMAAECARGQRVAGLTFHLGDVARLSGRLRCTVIERSTENASGWPKTAFLRLGVVSDAKSGSVVFGACAVRVDLVDAAASERGELLNDRAVDENPQASARYRAMLKRATIDHDLARLIRRTLKRCGQRHLIA